MAVGHGEDGGGDVRLAIRGTNSSPGEAAALEDALRSAPDDLAARTRLLGHYFRRQFEERDRRRAHVLWLVAHAPAAEVAGSPFGRIVRRADPEGYEAAAAAWQAVLDAHPDVPVLLANAAAFFLASEPDRAEALLRHGRALAPQEPAWAERLAHLHGLRAVRADPDERPALARRALAELERARPADGDDAEATSVWLVAAARAALAAGEAERARRWALELLAQAAAARGTWNHGNAVHHGHLVLGHLALGAGDAEEATAHLLAAGQTPGSPQLNSFGPNVVLAKELLDLGERETALAFLAACRRFWPRPELERWQAVIRDGGVPDFGPNLAY